MFEGRTLDQKRKLVANLTEAVVRSLDVKPETVRITLFEKKKEDMAVGGQLFLDKEE
jgi:4-oxalocrotonate tautomerase